MKTVVLKHGCPVQLITDNASYYVKGNFPQLCKILGIKLSPVTAYHPQANGIAESKVKALKHIIRALVKKITQIGTNYYLTHYFLLTQF